MKLKVRHIRRLSGALPQRYKSLLLSQEEILQAGKNSPGESREQESRVDRGRHVDGCVVIFRPEVESRGEEVRDPLISFAREDESTSIEGRMTVRSESYSVRRIID